MAEARAMLPMLGPEPKAPPDLSRKAEKRRGKTQSAWISFAGRILAQIIGAVATVVLGVYAVGQLAQPREHPGRDTAALKTPPQQVQTLAARIIAVLPLENLSGDAQQDYFADGMTEAIIARLAETKGLRVISRTSSLQYKGEKTPLKQIAAELGAALVVEGSIRRIDNVIRVTAQLIDARDDEHLWAASYETTSADVLAVQTDVASAIARAIADVVFSEPAP